MRRHAPPVGGVSRADQSSTTVAAENWTTPPVGGIDLTEEYVTTGQVMCDWVGLGDRVSLRQGSALAMPFEADSFDGAYMLHVGMNIDDKRQLCAEVHRVRRPGACFGIYDVMRTGEGELAYPVPWAATPETSAVHSLDEYRVALRAAECTTTAERNRRDFALEFFAKLKASTTGASGSAPLGLHEIQAPLWAWAYG